MNKKYIYKIVWEFFFFIILNNFASILVRSSHFFHTYFYQHNVCCSASFSWTVPLVESFLRDFSPLIYQYFESLKNYKKKLNKIDSRSLFCCCIKMLVELPFWWRGWVFAHRVPRPRKWNPFLETIEPGYCPCTLGLCYLMAHGIPALWTQECPETLVTRPLWCPRVVSASAYFSTQLWGEYNSS